MKMLDFIKSYNTYKLTESEADHIYEKTHELSERAELAFVNTEKCTIEAWQYEYYDDEKKKDIECTIFNVLEIENSDCCSLREMIAFEEAVTKDRDEVTVEFEENKTVFKTVATYKCLTEEECKDFLITVIKNVEISKAL